MKVKALLGAFFVLVLCTDSSSGLHYLFEKAQLAKNPFKYLYLAADQGDESALEMLTQLAISQKSLHWLEMAYQKGSLDAGYHFSQSLNVKSQKQLLRHLAQAGHANSQYDLALQLEHAGSRVAWLQKASEQGLLDANIALYQWFMLHQQPSQALPWMHKAAQRDAVSAQIYAKTLWQKGEYDQAKQWFERAVDMGAAQSSEYLTLIRTFSPYSTSTQSSNAQPLSVTRSNCLMKLVFAANSLESMRQATAFIAAFKQDVRLAALPICVQAPVWLAEEILPCTANWRSNQRITCNLQRLAERFNDIQATHLAIFSQQGKANVHNGIMYLDLADTYDVFVHELAHFVGFADEYPLSASMADAICSQSEHPNLVIKQAQTQTDLSSDESWFEPEAEALALAKARTCNNHSAQAYKRSRAITFMEFYDQRDIPQAYLDIWQTLLHERGALTPFYVNFAQMYESTNQTQKADFWWQKYQEFKKPSSQIPTSDVIL